VRLLFLLFPDLGNLANFLIENKRQGDGYQRGRQRNLEQVEEPTVQASSDQLCQARAHRPRTINDACDRRHRLLALATSTPDVSRASRCDRVCYAREEEAEEEKEHHQLYVGRVQVREGESVAGDSRANDSEQRDWRTLTPSQVTDVAHHKAREDCAHVVH